MRTGSYNMSGLFTLSNENWNEIYNNMKTSIMAETMGSVAVSSKGKITAQSEGVTYVTAIDGEGKIIGTVYVSV